MKCERCGKVYDEPVSICTDCGYDFDEAPRLKKLFKVKPEPKAQIESDLFDNPVFTFIFGLLSLLLPVYLFSILAIKMSKKPARVSLEPFRNLGKVFGYLGILVSTVVIGLLLFTFVF